MSKYILGDIYKGDYPTTQRYGDNPQIYTMFQIPGHEGWDIGCPTGTEVLAPFDGIILRDTFGDKDYGNFTVIWDPTQHCAVWYCHLQDVTTNTGDKVTKGQVVGHTNNTGHSTGPHLHVNFVETDASGNRLNLDNGKQGFLNILDPNLVSWELAGHMPQPQPTPGIPVITDQTKIDMGDDGIIEVQAARSLLHDRKQTIAGNQSTMNGLNLQIKDLQKQLSDCQNRPVTTPETTATTGNDPNTTTIVIPPVQPQPSIFQQLSDFFGHLWKK